LKQNIETKGYTLPTPIQDKAIKPILLGRDLIGLAQTGTGKTAAFLIPILDKIFKNRNTKALIIAPTRELVLQINTELREFSQGMSIYSTQVIGGANIQRQIHEIRRNPHIVVGTPGRLKDLIKRGVLRLDDFSIFVLDEVDLMVDIGFIHEIKYFLSLLPKVRQSLFFSATISPKVKEILNSFVSNPVTVSVKSQPTSENVNQDVVKVTNPSQKVDLLHDLLIKDGFDKVLIFGRTKHGVEKLNTELSFRGFKTGALHGNKKMGHRKRVLESFKRSEIQILLATDVASRGLDIDNVTHVINYELPETFEDYIHRIGRTGRAGKTGTALTFIDTF
jgi:superfamily II DNA/RNA helicase